MHSIILLATNVTDYSVQRVEAFVTNSERHSVGNLQEIFDLQEDGDNYEFGERQENGDKQADGNGRVIYKKHALKNKTHSHNLICLAIST